MAKMRVHELAKELGIENKKIIEFLSTTEYAVKSHSSSVEEAVQEIVRKKLGKGPAASNTVSAEKKEAPKTAGHAETASAKVTAPAAKAEETKAPEKKAENTEGKTERPKKKSSITAVFNAQYSKQGAAHSNSGGNANGRRPAQQHNGRPQNNSNNGDRRPQGNNYNGDRRSQEQRQAKPMRDYDVRKAFERAINPEAAKAAEEAEKLAAQKALEAKKAAEEAKTVAAAAEPAADKKEEKPAESAPYQNVYQNVYEQSSDARPQSSNAGDRRPQGNNYNGNRSQGNSTGDRRPQGSNYAGNRPQGNNTGDRRPQGSNYAGNRPQGSNTGDRRPQGSNYAGNRPQGTQGSNYAGNRPQGSNYAGNRPQGSNTGDRRPQGNNYAGNRPQGDRQVRPGQSGFAANRGGRPDGNQRPYQNGRPNQNSTQGDRNNNRSNTYRGGQPNAGRGDNKETAAVTTEELRGKESRDRDKDRNKSVKQRKDYDPLGSKKQERFVNLEKNGGKKRPGQQQQQPKQEEEVIRTLTLPEKLTIKELAEKMKVQPAVIVKKLFLKGTMVTVNQEVTYETAEEIALEFNCVCEPEVKIDVIAELLKEEDDSEDTLVARPPVVCVMGHVDHGKTSLLDAIRSTRVTDREAGGITQHIGASVVSINGQNITFLDTPGHEAFTAMRMRGANSTDIAILVVAADDGVMPQTIEAINHAKAAGVEIIVAINKVDKPSANIERVKQELSEYELIPEDWGGSTIFCPVSAHTRDGIDNLLEMILLTAEVLELKANPSRNARGLVIEAQLDKGRGAVATVLVQKGTLKVGQPIACGSCYGKVRAMIDDQGRRLKEAGPSTPVEILGLSSVPEAGETFVSTDSDKEARTFAETYISEGKNKLIEDTKAKMSLDDLFTQIKSGNVKELNIIVKADVQGSVEAVKQSLVKLSNEEVVVKVIHGGVGAINESDVSLASASNAIIIGFNVRPDPTAKVTAEKESVDVRLYKVIYNAIEDVEAAMKGMLDPIFEEKVLGHAEVRQIFKASGIGNIAGSYILDGLFQRGCKVRISREGKQIFEGDLASLKRFKDDVKEVKSGYECGLVFDGFNEIEELDIVEAYTMVEVPR